jgi:hypothetical protein
MEEDKTHQDHEDQEDVDMDEEEIKAKNDYDARVQREKLTPEDLYYPYRVLRIMRKAYRLPLLACDYPVSKEMCLMNKKWHRPVKFYHRRGEVHPKYPEFGIITTSSNLCSEHKTPMFPDVGDFYAAITTTFPSIADLAAFDPDPVWQEIYSDVMCNMSRVYWGEPMRHNFDFDQNVVVPWVVTPGGITYPLENKDKEDRQVCEDHKDSAFDDNTTMPSCG